MLVNVARGGVYDEAVVAAALVDGKIAGAAFDVYEKEPPVDSPLLTAPNTVLTPHLGALTAEAQLRVAEEACEQVIDVLAGRSARYAVNAPLLTPETSRAIAQDDLFPRPFAWTDKKGTAWFGILVGTALPSILMAWRYSTYVNKVAAAGKAVYPLPLYANAALRDPLTPGAPGSYESGGPTDNVIPIWKVTAPAIDIVAPDIYQNDPAAYLKVLELYHSDDNALFVPETSSGVNNTRFLFSALGLQAIGYSPFGMDYTNPRNTPESLAPTAKNYRLFAPMAREIARQTGYQIDEHRFELFGLCPDCQRAPAPAP